jgi:DNA-binding MltR family transcriptional regulator
MSQPDWIIEHFAIRENIEKESDRAAAVFAGSFLDEMLSHILAFYFVQDKKTSRELLRGDGPLSSFSARIKVAYAIGLISESVRSDFEIIRKIRNHFAHHPRATSFSESPVREHCANLAFVKWFKVHAEEAYHRTPREHFLGAVMSLSAYGQVLFTELADGDRPRCIVPSDVMRFGSARKVV